MKPMNEAEALAYYDLVLARLFGWTLALSVPDGGLRDGRRRAVRDADALYRDLFLAKPEVDTILAAIVAGDDVVLLWPEEYRAVVRFQIGHKVPRAVNEPTSAEYAASKREGGRTDYELPAFLADHGRFATVENHPAWHHLVTGRAAA